MTKKARLINKLTALSNKEKTQIISFFSKYPNYENRIDWNRKSLQYSDFEKVFALAENSKNSIKLRAKENPRLLFENYNCKILCQTEDYIVMVPLDWECAVFLNSFNCGGEGAKWCIGDKNTSSFWYDYISSNILFIFVFFKKRQPYFGKKFIIQKFLNSASFIWLQNNKKIKSQKYINLYYYCSIGSPNNKIKGISKKKIKMYSKLFRGICKDLFFIENELWKKIEIPKYVIENSTLSKWLDKEAVEAVIPESVTSIGDQAFFMNEKITIVNIPSSVTSIGAEAFFSCKKLTIINIPDGVISIGYEAFWGCENLKSINIPDSVTYIGTDAFYGCKNLEFVDILNGTRIPKDVFEINLFGKFRKRKVDSRQLELWDL